MGNLITTLNDLIEVIKSNSVPLLFTIIGTSVPIFLSVLVIIQSHRQNRQNRELQKKITERDIKVQMHGDILKIYDDFCSAQNVIQSAKNRVNEIFSNFNAYNYPIIPIRWINDVTNAVNGMIQAINRGKLLLPASDTKLRNALETIFKMYLELKDNADKYLYSGNAASVANRAWNTVSKSHNIPINDYNLLMNNYDAYDAFLKLCESEETKKINEIITNILPLFEYDKFDKYFEPYLQMNLSDDNT